MASTDEKKRTQEASETDFTTRGGRQDATSGTGKPHTSPCKKKPEIPSEAADQFERSMMRSCGECPVPLTVRGTQTLVSFAPLAFKLFYAARQNAVLRRSPFPPP